MGRLIDEDTLIDAIPDLSVFEEDDFCTSDMIHLIERKYANSRSYHKS